MGSCFCRLGHFLSISLLNLIANQKKIDINYYDISIDIDLENSEISGTVLIEGFVGMDQPAFIELDLSSNMNVDSIKLGNELTNLSIFTKESVFIISFFETVPAP